MENKIELQLLAVDFKDTEFNGSGPCAIEKAGKRSGAETFEFVDYLKFVSPNTHEKWIHEEYTADDFYADKKIAETNGFGAAIIRTLTLTKA